MLIGVSIFKKIFFFEFENHSLYRMYLHYSEAIISMMVW